LILTKDLTKSFCQQTTQNELDEQEERLRRLHQLGKDLIEDSGNDDEITKEINAQLQDFDDCWNHVAKRTLEEKEKVRNNTLDFEFSSPKTSKPLGSSKQNKVSFSGSKDLAKSQAFDSVADLYQVMVLDILSRDLGW